MTRRRKRHAAALSLLILTTAPGYALLCRGHSPSRFAPDNLPVWERTLPRPAPSRVALHSSTLLGTLPTGESEPSMAQLAHANPNDLFSSLEHPSREFPSPAGAGRPGLWLLAACPLSHRDAALRAQQEVVALRLMEAQHGDGYLAAGTGTSRWTRAQIAAHGQNLRGLLAYYSVSHSPAAVYAAIQAGDLVLRRFPGVQAATSRADSLVSPMTLLYQASGEARYRRWAEKYARAGLADGSGLCALYVATGQKHYLHSVQRVWRQDCARHQSDQDLAAALWALTGAPAYAKALHPSVTPERYTATGRLKKAT